MGLIPNIPQNLDGQRQCMACGTYKQASKFPLSKNLFHDKYSPICADCIDQILSKYDYDWQAVDRFCQFLNIPFVPEEWEKIRQQNSADAVMLYSQIFGQRQYEYLNWHMYYEEFKKLEKAQMMVQEMPRLKDDRLAQLHAKWGENYAEEQLDYLESLYNGLLLSQNVNGALQIDQAKKLCKTSLEIDERIRAGEDYDKMLSSYDKIIKIAEFTPKNAKNAADFDSVGELVRWLEKKGWKNQFYDDVTRDIVDETIKNIQLYNQHLYTDESGIGEEITRRIEALKTATEMEDNFGGSANIVDVDVYDNEAYEGLKEEFDEEFKEEV